MARRIAPRNSINIPVNDGIAANRIMLIDEKGDNHGIVDKKQALVMAAAAGMDLVLIGQNLNPPVARILNYGKHRYEMQKKKQQSRKKQKTVSIKEIKMRPTISIHDYEVKTRAIRRFLDDGDKVKVTLRLRGREIANKQIGVDLLEKVKEEISDISKAEKDPTIEGRQVTMVLSVR